MYPQNEVEISRMHLEKVISSIDEPVVVLGGWAVYFLVNRAYRETTGREYIGSRDIDLGFHIEEDKLKESAFDLAFGRLEEMGFRAISFRLFKEIEIETGRTLSPEEAKQLPSYRIFPMYVDLIVDTIPTGFRERYGFTPIDEPVLKSVFEHSEYRVELVKWGRELWLPLPELLLAMKIKSYMDRDKEHKRLKDLADIAALILFTRISKKMWDERDANRFTSSLTSEEMKRTADILGLNYITIENAVRKTMKNSHL